MSDGWRGIFPIVVTPFTASGELDEASLRCQVHFCLEAGAAGLTGPANASEFTTLSDEERRRWLQIVTGEVAGAVPVIASVTCGHLRPAADLARFAVDCGADAIMSMPPLILPLDEVACAAYYRDLATAVDAPLVIQNHSAPLGTPLSAAALGRLCAEVASVQYIKEEVAPEPRRISAALAAAGEHCRGVFGGQGAIYLIDEHRRGAAGNMPGSQLTDVLVDVWNLLEAGSVDEARSLFDLLLPMMSYERLYGVAVYKEVLRRRGVIDCALRRAPGGGLGGEDLVEIDGALARLEPVLRL